LSTLIHTGKIVKSIGLKGRVKVHSYMESPQRLESLDEVFIGPAKKGALPFRVTRVGYTRGAISLDLEGVSDAASSKALVGFNLYIPAGSLDELESDEYYWRDILGLDVLTEEGRILGQIEDIIPTGSNDVYVCRGGEREILLPAIEEVIRRVDIERGVLVVRLLEGL